MAFSSIKPVTLKSGKVRFKAKVRKKNGSKPELCECKTCDTKEEAEAFVELILAQVEDTKHTVTINAHLNTSQVLFRNYDNKTTFKTVADVLTWEINNREGADKPYSKSSLSMFRQPLKYDIASVKLHKLKLMDFESYISTRMAANVSGHSAMTEIRFIFTALNNAATKHNPSSISRKDLAYFQSQLEKKKNIIKYNKRTRRLKSDEETKLLKAASQFEKAHFFGFPYPIVIGLLTETCLRLNELFALTRDDIDLNNRQIRISNLKTPNRKAPPETFTATMTEKGRELFAELLTWSHSSRASLFGMQGKTFAGHVRKITRKAGIKDFMVNDLRYEGIKRKMESGFEPYDIAKLFTGHKGLDVVNNRKQRAAG